MLFLSIVIRDTIVMKKFHANLYYKLHPRGDEFNNERNDRLECYHGSRYPSYQLTGAPNKRLSQVEEINEGKVE